MRIVLLRLIFAISRGARYHSCAVTAVQDLFFFISPDSDRVDGQRNVGLDHAAALTSRIGFEIHPSESYFQRLMPLPLREIEK